MFRSYEVNFPLTFLFDIFNYLLVHSAKSVISTWEKVHLGNLFLLECYNFSRKLPKEFILLILSIVGKFSLQQPDLISNLPGFEKLF